MSGSSRFAEDNDLHDLIGSSNGNHQRDNDDDGDKKSEMKPFNLEHLSQGELDVPVQRSAGRRNNSQECGLLKLCCAYLAYACDYAPKFCWCIGIVALLVPAYFLAMAVFFNPMEHFGMVHDYSDVKSQYDLDVGKIDHWCIKGDNDSCRCEDPLEPQPRAEFRNWATAQNANTNMVNELVTLGQSSPDICFLGASIVEEMSGRWFGRSLDGNLNDLKLLFENKFQKKKGGQLDAVALGIAGDTAPTVLWRLMNGEMPTAFNPKIWWLEIGLNDLGRSQCSEEVVVLGVLRVVEEILTKKPDATVVINSLFPLADLRGGLRVGADDFKDSFDKSLRQRPTNKIMPKNRGGNRKKRAVDSDNGDATHIKGGHLNEDDKKKKGKKNRGIKGNKGNPRKDRRFLYSRDLAAFRKQDGKPVKMVDYKEKQRKYNIITHHEHKLPLWTSVSAINRQLRKFANKQEKVFFFDSTEIFTERDEGNTYILKTDLISIRGHPTKKGYDQWEDAVIKKAKQFLNANSW